MVVDAERELVERTGARDGGALFVRPDGYVGFHVDGHDAAVPALFDRWVARPTAAGATP